MGHESQIEPWLALTTTLLDASETDERRYASKMNRKNRRFSHQYMGWMSEGIPLCPPVAGEVFLALPFRTLLRPGWCAPMFILSMSLISKGFVPDSIFDRDKQV
jgi:hypothetical protein